jgi:hypothetical protein
MSYNLKVYQMIRDNGGWMQFKMIIIKEFPCNTKIELLIEEDKMMRELNSNLNNYRAHQTEDERKEYVRHYKKEYFFNNKEKEKEKAKEYRLNNKEKIKEQRQTKFICECGSYCCIENKVRHLNSLKHKQYLLINTK